MSPKSIEGRAKCVGYFASFLGRDPELSEIGANDLRRFILALQESPKYQKHPYKPHYREKISPTSIATYTREIKAFFSYLAREELIDRNPMEGVKVPKAPQKVVRTLDEKEVAKLLSQPDKYFDRGFRDYTLMLIFYDTGVRLSELANLREGDVDFENGYLRVVGKGNKERYVPFGQKVAKALLKYKVKHRPQPLATDRFFLTVDGRPLEAGRIEKIISEHARKAGIRCYPHKLRHTSSVAYLRNGGDPFTLQKKLGHASLTMTRHYVNLADADVRAQHLRYSPADRLGV
jgi:site-specific recombinase XerD